MFKYKITAWVEDKTGYYTDKKQVTPVVVYATNAKGAIDKTKSIVPPKKSSGRDYVWIVRIDSIEELLVNDNEV